jgi:hypothetical protein
MNLWSESRILVSDSGVISATFKYDLQGRQFGMGDQSHCGEAATSYMDSEINVVQLQSCGTANLSGGARPDEIFQPDRCERRQYTFNGCDRVVPHQRLRVGPWRLSSFDQCGHLESPSNT